jgi:hypothetical protein
LNLWLLLLLNAINDFLEEDRPFGIVQDRRYLANSVSSEAETVRIRRERGEERAVPVMNGVAAAGGPGWVFVKEGDAIGGVYYTGVVESA